MSLIPELINIVWELTMDVIPHRTLISLNKYYNNYKYFKVYLDISYMSDLVCSLYRAPNFHLVKREEEKIEYEKNKKWISDFCYYSRFDAIDYYICYTGLLNDRINQNVKIPDEIYKKIKIFNLSIGEGGIYKENRKKYKKYEEETDMTFICRL
jgi:hypothetical protein